MPINPSALGTPAPSDEPQEATKRKRRTRAELIADAVVPGDNDFVELKDSGTGAKIQRPWLVAVEMVRGGKAEWADKAMKYALMKFDQQKVRGAFEPSATDGSDDVNGLVLRWNKLQEQLDDAKPGEVEKITTLSEESENVRNEIISLGGADPALDGEQPAADTGQESGKKGDAVPPDAEVGDEVRVGSETYRVGHGRVLVQGMISESGSGELLHAKRRWQRQLGSGSDGPWESTVLTPPSAEQSASNGHGGEVTVQTETQPPQVERVGEIEWKIGTGILQKIGLPDYSQLQVGPVNASRMVIDDGRRTTVQVGGRTAEIPTAVIEGFQEVTDAVEYVARYQRGELVSFLESVGALTQPVSS